MPDAIRRFLGDLRPADWAILAVELAFLGVVGLQWALDVIHKRKMRKRHGELFDMQQRGNELLRVAPRNIALTPEDRHKISEWEDFIKTWIRQTADTL